MRDSRFPRRRYPYRLGVSFAAAGPAVALVPGAVYRFVLGLDEHPTILGPSDLASLKDPLGKLLGTGRSPQTLNELLSALDAAQAVVGVSQQKWYLVGDGGQIPFVSEPGLERNLRVAASRAEMSI
jgi:hypothetical protein